MVTLRRITMFFLGKPILWFQSFDFLIKFKYIYTADKILWMELRVGSISADCRDITYIEGNYYNSSSHPL